MLNASKNFNPSKMYPAQCILPIPKKNLKILSKNIDSKYVDLIWRISNLKISHLNYSRPHLGHLF